MHRQSPLLFFLLFFSIAFFFSPLNVFAASSRSGDSPESPKAVVERFHDSLLEAMKRADELGLRGRFKFLAPRIEESFDQIRMIRVATGATWRAANKKQRQRLLDAFVRMSVGTYADQFNRYSGQSFKTVRERQGPQKTILLETKILNRNGGTEADLTYVLMAVKKRWRIVDILLDNTISQLAVRRSEYRRILKKDGIEGLIAALKAKADDLLKNSPGLPSSNPVR